MEAEEVTDAADAGDKIPSTPSEIRQGNNATQAKHRKLRQQSHGCLKADPKLKKKFDTYCIVCRLW